MGVIAWLLRVALLSDTLQLARGQFGGGGFGGGGYTPPAPICPAFSCPAGQKAVGKPEHSVWSYGCKDSGMNFINAASLDPNNPFAGQQKISTLDKCCVERDICKQTCGMTSKACHDNFQKCSTKTCKGDQNCQLQAMMSDIMSEPYDDTDKGSAEKYDPDKMKCKGYDRGQSQACMCVDKSDWKDATERKLKSFYGKFNPEKLDSSGEIKDVGEVWKKWKGKEPDMFMALTTKYKKQAVEIRVRPKPPPYKPPKDKEDESTEADAEPIVEEASAEAPAPEPEKKGLDEEDRAFEAARSALEAKKAKAAEEEDFDLADQVKEDAKELARKEAERLKAKKAKAIEEEDFAEAKRIKKRLEEL